MSLSTHLFRSLFALPLLAISVLALALPQTRAAGADASLAWRMPTPACLEAARPAPALTQVPADLSPRLRRLPPTCRG